MSKIVTIVDYGVGNLKSVARVFEHAGATANVTADPHQIVEADRLILPGVGAFGHCMQELKGRRLEDAIKQFVRREKPFLGICVGMQIMLSLGEEFGEHAGLDVISGRVRRIADCGADGAKHILPYIGWAKLQADADWQASILRGITSHDYVYFLHSFQAECADPANCLASYDYDGISITAAIFKDHLTGLQFHPEKSGETGIKIIGNFLEQ